MSQSPFSQTFFLGCNKMVKVTKGALPGERAEGYQSYTTSYGVGPGVTVRRGIPATDLPTVGTSLAQKQQKYSFGIATKIYSKYNNLQQDFFKRWWILDKTVDPQNRLAKRILTGQDLAMHDIMRTMSTSGQTYPKPLGFCICAIDTWGNPALRHELNITCPKLGNFEYKEKNDNYACFPPSSLSPKYDPYHLFYTDNADYCLLTAEEIHKIKTLSIDKNINFFHKGPFNYSVDSGGGWTAITYFGERGLPLPTYNMRCKLRWSAIIGDAVSTAMFSYGLYQYDSAPMPPGQAGEITLWTIGHDRSGVWITIRPGGYEYIHFKDLEISIDVVNLPC